MFWGGKKCLAASRRIRVLCGRLFDPTEYLPFPSVVGRWVAIVVFAPSLYRLATGAAFYDTLLPFRQIGGMLHLIRVHRTTTFPTVSERSATSRQVAISGDTARSIISNLVVAR